MSKKKFISVEYEDTYFAKQALANAKVRFPRSVPISEDMSRVEGNKVLFQINSTTSLPELVQVFLHEAAGARFKA